MLSVVLWLGLGASDPGSELLEQVDRVFWSSSRSVYFEKLGSDQPAFNWGVGVALTALNEAAKRDERWKERLRTYLRTAESYWNPAPPVPGFDVLPGPKPADRYYDDNAWMAMALIEAAEVLKEPKWIDLAAKTMDYVLSGKDEKLGGGIYWNETEKNSKNTCSNAPSAAAMLLLHQVRPELRLLQEAIGLYSWTKAKLRDPADGLYWDNVRLDGTVQKTKWSYNSALMLRTALLLHEATGQDSYRRDADETALAAAKRWVLTDGRMACEGRFAHLLLEDLLDYEARTKSRVLDRARVRGSLLGLARDGWHGKRWDAPRGSGEVELIDQMSVVRALLVLSR